jgi:cytochrome c-type biogenesis protein
VLTDAVALFGAGIASFLAPCVVPLVPAYLGMITSEAGQAAGSVRVGGAGAAPAGAAPGTTVGTAVGTGSASGAGVRGAVAGAPGVDVGVDQRAPARAVVATLLFVAGFAVVFAGLGVTAGLAGSSLQAFQDGIERVGGVLVAVFGLAMLGVLRGPFARERRLISRLPSRGGRLRPVVVGVAFGAAWSPCVGPLLGAALVAAARTGDPLQGGILLFAYACGIGVPFVAASLGLASAPGALHRLTRLGPRLERIAGVLLVVLGVLLATGWYRHLSSYLAQLAPAVGGL